MAQNFNFGFSGDDIDDGFDEADPSLPRDVGPDIDSSTPPLVEPQLHTLQELVSDCYFIVKDAVFSLQIDFLALHSQAICFSMRFIKNYSFFDACYQNYPCCPQRSLGPLLRPPVSRLPAGVSILRIRPGWPCQ